MKKYILFLMLMVLIGCETDNMSSCFRKSGKMVTKTFPVEDFHEIMTYARVSLFITDGPEQEVKVETGENLMKDISVEVKDGQLQLKDNNDCNLVRGYKKTKIYVTAPNIDFIQNGSQFPIKSTNTLHYDNLFLKTDDYNEKREYHIDGNFNLDLDCKNLKIQTTSNSGYFISGKTDNINIGIYSGNGRIEAENLQIKSAKIYHRGSNDILIGVKDSVSGKLLSTGDLILLNHPNFVEIEETYKGKVIYREED